MLLVGLVDIGDEVAIGDLGIVDAREALDRSRLLASISSSTESTVPAKIRLLVSSRISTTCPTSTPSANGGWSTVWREAVVRVPSDPEIESVPAR